VRRERAVAAVLPEQAARREQAAVRRERAMAPVRPERAMGTRPEQALQGGDSR
jgi:hypothetical protein